MARGRVKKRTQPRKVVDGKAGNHPEARTPKSMVIRVGAGEVGSSVSQLVMDVRRTLEPNTAIRLKERRSNKLRDYTTMAGALGVTHLLLFSRSSTGNTNMRLAITPRGPTLHFRVERYSLSKDVMRSMKHPLTGGSGYLNSPLLVMNNFLSSLKSSDSSDPPVPKHLESLCTTVFQSLFPPISPQSTPISSIKRVLLLNREPPKQGDNGSYTINLRHYAITTKITGLPRSIRRIKAAEKLITSGERRKKGVPNLGRLEDLADYLLDPSAAGFTSGSESEAETDAEVEILASGSRKVLNRKDRQRQSGPETAGEPQARSNGDKQSNGRRARVEKHAVKLIELGPRMKLRLTKVEEGLCGGKVMWHEFINKSEEEVKMMDEQWTERRRAKEERKRIQRENVERKRGKRNASGDNVEEEEMGDESDNDSWDSEEELDSESEAKDAKADNPLEESASQHGSDHHDEEMNGT